MLSIEREILTFAIVMLVCITAGTYIGRVGDLRNEGVRVWDHEWYRSRFRRGESEADRQAREHQEHREFLEVWKSNAPWGKTLRGALIGSLVGVSLYWLAAWIEPPILE